MAALTCLAKVFRLDVLEVTQHQHRLGVLDLAPAMNVPRCLAVQSKGVLFAQDKC